MQTVKSKTFVLTLTAVLMALEVVLTTLSFPIVATQGYIHLGDSIIFLSVFLIHEAYAIVAIPLGAALADAILGVAFWSPWTFVIKGLMVIVIAFIAHKNQGKNAKKIVEIASMVASGAVMVAGYYIAECVIAGNATVGLVAIPWNIVQMVVGIVIAQVVLGQLSKFSFTKDIVRNRDAFIDNK